MVYRPYEMSLSSTCTSVIADVADSRTSLFIFSPLGTTDTDYLKVTVSNLYFFVFL